MGNENPYIEEGQIGKRKKKGAVTYNILHRATWFFNKCFYIMECKHNHKQNKSLY
jgi:hypothetical protein